MNEGSGIKVYGTKEGKLFIKPEDLFARKEVQETIKKAAAMNDNSAHGFTEGSDIPNSHTELTTIGITYYQIACETIRDQEKRIKELEKRCDNYNDDLTMVVDQNNAMTARIKELEAAYKQRGLELVEECEELEAEVARLKKDVFKANDLRQAMEQDCVDCDRIEAERDKLREQVATLQKENEGWDQQAQEVERLREEVAHWKQRDKNTGEMILPVIGYMQEEGGADKWGIKPGQQIFKKVLEILKTQFPNDDPGPEWVASNILEGAAKRIKELEAELMEVNTDLSEAKQLMKELESEVARLKSLIEQYRFKFIPDHPNRKDFDNHFAIDRDEEKEYHNPNKKLNYDYNKIEFDTDFQELLKIDGKDIALFSDGAHEFRLDIGSYWATVFETLQNGTRFRINISKHLALQSPSSAKDTPDKPSRYECTNCNGAGGYELEPGWIECGLCEGKGWTESTSRCNEKD